LPPNPEPALLESRSDLRAGRVIANLDILCFLGADDQKGYVAAGAAVCADSGLERL